MNAHQRRIATRSRRRRLGLPTTVILDELRDHFRQFPLAEYKSMTVLRPQRYIVRGATPSILMTEDF